MVDALSWITYVNVRISCRVHYAVKSTVRFSATEVCVRIGHDKRV